MDSLSSRYGKHTVHLGASHPIEMYGKGKRGEATIREQTRLYGESRRKHLGLPIFHVPRESADNSPKAAKTGKNED